MTLIHQYSEAFMWIGACFVAALFIGLALWAVSVASAQPSQKQPENVCGG